MIKIKELVDIHKAIHKKKIDSAALILNEGKCSISIFKSYYEYSNYENKNNLCFILNGKNLEVSRKEGWKFFINEVLKKENKLVLNNLLVINSNV